MRKRPSYFDGDKPNSLSRSPLFWATPRYHIADPNVLIERLPAESSALEAQGDFLELFGACCRQPRKLRCREAKGAFIGKVHPNAPIFNPASHGLWRFCFQVSGCHENDDKPQSKNRNVPQLNSGCG